MQSAERQAKQQCPGSRSRGRVKDLPGDMPSVAGCMPEDEQVAGIGDVSRGAVRQSRAGPKPGAATAGQPRCEQDADHHDRERQQVAATGSLAQHCPGENGDDRHVQASDHSGDPGAGVGDRVVEEHEIDSQENTCQERVPSARQGPRATAAPLGDCMPSTGSASPHR